MDTNTSLQNHSLKVGDFHSNPTSNGTVEDLTIPRWCEIVMITYLYLTAILAIGGNCIILLVETNNRYKTSTDWLVSFMAGTDILFAIFPLPMYIIIQMGFFADIASNAICKLFRFTEYVTMFTSAMLLGTVAIDRYFKTCRPHTQFLTPTRALRCCITITTAACLLNSSTFGIIIYEGGDDCGFQQLAGGTWIGLLMTIFISSYVFMFVTVGFCYIKIAYTIRKKLFDHTVSATGESTATKETDTKGKINTSFRPMVQHKNNRIAPLVTAVNDLANEPTTQMSHFRLFDQSSDCCNNKHINSKDITDIFSTSNPNHLSHKIARNSFQNEAPHAKHRYETRVDRTTKIMFAVTLCFVLTWILTWCSHLYRSSSKSNPTFLGTVITFFTRKTFMINTFMNPIFYIWMSSAFKEKTRQTLKKLFSKCRRLL